MIRVVFHHIFINRCFKILEVGKKLCSPVFIPHTQVTQVKCCFMAHLFTQSGPLVIVKIHANREINQIRKVLHIIIS
ncbi:hypothetical protein D3C71_1399330 [compost metagenome]